MNKESRIFYFYELTENAQRNAAMDYREKNLPHEDFQVEVEHFQEYLYEQYEKMGIELNSYECNDNPVGIIIEKANLFSLKEFCETHNLKEEEELIEVLEKFVELDYDLFKKVQGYVKSFKWQSDNSYLYYDEDMMRYVVEFGEEEIKTKYELLHLMKQDLSESEEKEFIQDMEAMLEVHLSELENKLDDIITTFHEKMVNKLDEFVDYLGSVEFYQNELKNRFDKEEFIYNAEGKLIEDEDSEALQEILQQEKKLNAEEQHRLQQVDIWIDDAWREKGTYVL